MKTLFNWKINKIYLLLGLIIFLGFFLRFFYLGQNPPSLTWDEASWGYNAYSLGIDGKDEFGRLFPHDYLESFGDFKPPLYAYLDIIPVRIFGLNEFSARFPSALFGTLTILITYFLVKRIFYKKSLGKEIIRIEIVALLSSFFLAISPWHIMLSRAAFEANIATFLLSCGVWLFLVGVQDKKWHLILSGIFFALSLYAFNTARIVAPLLVIFLGIGFRRQLKLMKRKVIVAVIIGILLVLPTLKFLLSSQADLRFKEVNIFSDVSLINVTNQEINNDNNAFWSKIIHNRRFVFAAEYIKHYFDNLSPSFLFIKGDGNPKFSTQDVGEMYLWDLPFFIIGILFLFKWKEGNWWVVPVWLFLGIVPAASARETPHALRIETTLPTFQIFTAYGFTIFFFYLKNKLSNFKLKNIAILSFSFLFLLFNFLYFYHGYLAHYPREFSGEWQYGYKESIAYVLSEQDNYDLISITTSLGRPYIYYLFYSKANPQEYRKSVKVKRDPFGFVEVSGFGKYRFSGNLSIEEGKRVLYIDLPNKLPSKAKLLKTFYLLNGKQALIAYIR